MRWLLRRVRSFVLAFAWFHSDRVLESLLLEAQRMRAAGVTHTRAEWDSLSTIERASLIAAGGGLEVEHPSRSLSALHAVTAGVAGQASRRVA